MPEFKIHCGYSRKEKRKFFNDKGQRDYHLFLVENPEIIPNEYVCFTEKKIKPCFVWILDDLVKEAKIDFGNPYGKDSEFKFIINLGGDKTAKFNTNNKNWMVLKTKEYWENTVQKIGFWDSEDYFYESKNKTKKPIRKSEKDPAQPENKSQWGKIALVCLPIVIIALFIFLIFWMSKKKK